MESKKKTPEDDISFQSMDKDSPHYKDSYWEYVDAIIDMREKNKNGRKILTAKEARKETDRYRENKITSINIENELVKELDYIAKISIAGKSSTLLYPPKEINIPELEVSYIDEMSDRLRKLGFKVESLGKMKDGTYFATRVSW